MLSFKFIMLCMRLTCSYWLVFSKFYTGSDSVAEWLACWTQAQKARVQIAAATLSGNSLRQTVHTHCASVHQVAKLVASLLRVAEVTAGLAESNGSLPSGLWLTSPAGWLPRTGISSGTLRSVIEYGLLFYMGSRIINIKRVWRLLSKLWTARRVVTTDLRRGLTDVARESGTPPPCHAVSAISLWSGHVLEFNVA